jgi:hypothetical protein
MAVESVKAAGAKWWHETGWAAGRAAAWDLRDARLAVALGASGSDHSCGGSRARGGGWRLARRAATTSWLVGTHRRGSGEEREGETLV